MGPGLRARWILLLLLAAGGVGAWVLLGTRSGEGEPAAYTTATLSRGALRARVTATGTLSALVTVQVGSQVSGRISRILADYNSPVKKGQLIAEIDPQLFQAAVEQAAANLTAAQGNLAKAKVQAVDAERQAKRSEDLFAQKLISQGDRDTARATADAAHASVAAAEGEVAQARAALSQAKVNLAYTRIVSPTDGVVISRSVDVGQTVAATLQAPTLFVIAQDLRRMQVDTNVAESDIGKLGADMPVTFTVDAYPSDRFHGKIRQVRNAPQTVQNVVTYDAVIDVDNADLRLKPGMTANVSFVYADKADVLRLPNAALRFRPPPEIAGRAPPAKGREPGERTVWVLKNNAPEPVTVKLGISDGAVTEVISGDLHDGDAVITEARGGKSTPSFGRIL